MNANQTAAVSNLDWVSYWSSPVFTDSHKLIFAAWLGASLILIKKNLFARILLSLCALMLLQSSRYLLPASLILMSLLPELLEALRQRFSLSKSHLQIICVSLAVLIARELWLTIPRTLILHSSPEIYAHYSQPAYNYPFQATQILHSYPDGQKILNYYDWGGYLIMNLPAHRTFIDGRMDNFFIEGESFMQTYLTIINAEEGWERLFETYQPDLILLPPQIPLVQELRAEGWRVTYQDATSVLLEK